MSDAAPTLPEPPDDTLWEVADVARFLRVSKSWVYQATAAGTFPVIRLGSNLRFDPAAVRAYVRGERNGGKVVQLPGCRGSVARTPAG